MQKNPGIVIFLLIWLFPIHAISAQPKAKHYGIPFEENAQVQQLAELNNRWVGAITLPCQIDSEYYGCTRLFSISNDVIKTKYLDSLRFAQYGFKKSHGDLYCIGSNNNYLYEQQIFKVDEDLNVQLQTRFTPADTNWVVPTYFHTTDSSAYVFSNRYLYFKNRNLPYASQPWITKLDANWEVEWERAIPNFNNTWQSFPQQFVELTEDAMTSYFSSFIGDGTSYFWSLATMDQNGKIVKSVSKDTFRSYNHTPRIVKLNNGNLILNWRSWLPEEYLPVKIDTGFFDAQHLQKLDANWNLVWKVYYPVSYQYVINEMLTLRNGDILLIGSLEDRIRNGPIDYNQLLPWVARINQDGVFVWNRIFENNTLVETRAREYGNLFCGFEAEDGRIVVGGYYAPVRQYIPWVYELDSMGCLTPGCSGFRQIIHPDGTVTSVDEPAGSFQLQQGPFYVYPNPIQESFTFENTTTSPVQLQVFNLQGQMISSHVGLGQGIHRLSLSPTLAPGVYVWQAVGKNGVLQSGKLQKE